MAFTLLFPPLAAAQQKAPLAEVARKEAERRKGIKPTQKVITTKDLPESAKKPAAAAPAAHGGEGTAPAAGAGAAPAANASSSSSPGSEQKDEKHWRDRMTNAREILRRNEAFAQALQTRVNALSIDLGRANDRVVITKLSEELTKAREELARVRDDLEQSKKQVDGVEDDARKAGVPPGWLR